MKIQIKDISAVYINPDRFLDRKKKMENWINNVGFQVVERLPFNKVLPDRANTMTLAHITALTVILEKELYPCIIFEDDATLMRSLPEYFDVPEEADLVYLGGSNYNLLGIKLEEYNKDFYRVYNMLSLHAFLLHNKESAEKILAIMNGALSNSKTDDIIIASSSTENIFLVPKEGNYFFQDDYTSNVTKFLWKDYLLKNKLK